MPPELGAKITYGAKPNTRPTPMTTVLSSKYGETTKMSLMFFSVPFIQASAGLDRIQIYKQQKIINYAGVKKQDRLLIINGEVPT